MRSSTVCARFPPAAIAAGIAVTLLAATPAMAQQTRPGEKPSSVYGEKYNFEVATTWWTPSVRGFIQSDGLELIGSNLSFENDLGYESTRFRDLRFVVRPAKKHRIRVQYTPIEYTAATMFNRDVTMSEERRVG